MKHATLSVYLVAGLFLAIGFGNFLSPAEMLEFADVHLEHPNAKTEIRTYLGGLEIAIGFFVLYLIRLSRIELAVQFSLFIYSGIMAGRITGGLIDGVPDPYLPLVVAVEGFVFFNLIFAALKLAKARL